MSQQLINIGALPNDGSGDPLRVAFGKINNNFSQLFYTNYSTLTSYTIGNTPNQVIFEVPESLFTQGKFQINSSDAMNLRSQNVTITSSKKMDGSSVRFSAYGTLFEGSPVTTYNMDIALGNVRILCSPLVSDMLTHFVAYQVMNTSLSSLGVDLALDGYPDDFIMVTENGEYIGTEL
jgi:hypothetical protein